MRNGPKIKAMIDLLVSSPLLTLIVTMALGTLVGAIPFGPLKFGPAGALFVGLAIGALDPRLGSDLDLVESLGLALCAPGLRAPAPGVGAAGLAAGLGAWS